MAERKRGRPLLYKQNGAKPTPPPGGWKSCSSNTPHGKVAIDLIKSGKIDRSTALNEPHIIWNRYAELQVVDYRTFKRFLSRVLDTVDASYENDPHYTGPNTHTMPRLNRDPDDEESGSATGSRMVCIGGLELLFLSLLDSLTTLDNFSQLSLYRGSNGSFDVTDVDAPDAPSSSKSHLPTPLRSHAELRKKHQRVGLETEVIPVEESAFIILATMQKGAEESTYSVSVHEEEPCLLDIVYPRNPLLRNETEFEEALTSGRQPMINGEVAMVSPTDRHLHAVKTYLVMRNGGTALEVSINLFLC